jgi:hypothetical protein
MKIIEFDLDLKQLTKDCRRINNKVTKAYGEQEVPQAKKYEHALSKQLEQAPTSSRLHDFYNVFTFPYVSINELYRKVCSEFNKINTYDNKYYVHAWLNYQQKGESIPWHNHWKALSDLDETYVASYYINTEPSVTRYKWADGKIFDHHAENNTFSIYEDEGDTHMVNEWQQDEPRIGVSMDFVPMHYIQSTPYVLNTWMPVL